MSDQILFDKLRYIDRLKSGGITEEQARAHAEAIDDALREVVATRRDLADARSGLEARIELAVRDLTIRLGGLIAAGVALLAGIKYFG
jgi:hypothetical protein